MVGMRWIDGIRRVGRKASPIGVLADGRYMLAAQLACRSRSWQLAAAAKIPRKVSKGEPTVEEAQRLAPVRTGALRDSIYWRKVRELIYEIGATVAYAIYVEYGTWKMRAQPYLRPAVLRYQNQITYLFRTRIGAW